MAFETEEERMRHALAEDREMTLDLLGGTQDLRANAEITDLPADMQPLVTTLMLHSAQENAQITGRLMESYKRERDEARAELDLIRLRISELFAGPWMPNKDYVLDALYPSEAAIQRRIEKGD